MRAWLPVVLSLPFALAGCPAVLSDWTISGSGGVDASFDARDTAKSRSGSGSKGNRGIGHDAAATSDAGRDAIVEAGGTVSDARDDQRDMASGRCISVASKAEQVPVDLLIMFDQSLSMSCMIASGEDRWDAVKTALETFVQDPGAAGINVGIGYYGSSMLSSCDGADYQTPDVEIAPLPMNAMPIVSSLNAHMPISNTPTAAALTGAINHAIYWKNAHPGDAVVVVLVTDGEPNACGAVSDVANLAAMGLIATIPTYVIGVTSPGATCNMDPNPPNQQDLDTVAMAGGTMSALIVDTGQNPEPQFLAAMNQILAKSQTPCEYALPKPASGSQFDPNKVNIEFVPPDAGMGTPVPGVTMATCDPNGGWYYDNPLVPTRIELCPSTCSNLGATPLNVVVGCATKAP